MPHHPSTPRGRPKDAATNLQLLEVGNERLPCKGELWPSFQGRLWSDPGALSAKLFNIIVDTVVRKWMRSMSENLNDSDGKPAKQIEAIFANFYVDNDYIASRDAKFLQ